MFTRSFKEEFSLRPVPRMDENCAFDDFHPAYFELAAMKREFTVKGDIHEHR